MKTIIIIFIAYLLMGINFHTLAQCSLPLNVCDEPEPLILNSLTNANMTVSWTQWYFPNTIIAHTVIKTITITNTGTSGNLNISWTSLPAPFSVTPAGSAPILPGHYKIFTVIFHPIAVGNFSASWQINNNSDNLNPVLPIPLFGIGTCGPIYMSISPVVCDFGNVSVSGPGVTHNITVFNLSASCGPLIINPDPINPFFSVTPSAGPYSIAPGQSKVFAVTFHPSMPVPVHAPWLIIENSSNHLSPYEVTLKGNGIP